AISNIKGAIPDDFKSFLSGSSEKFDYAFNRNIDAFNAAAIFEGGVGLYNVGKGLSAGLGGLSSLKLLGNEVGSVNFSANALPRGTIAGSCASLNNLSLSEIQRIQNAANRKGVEINLVGSRVTGKADYLSDYDYVVDANSRVLHSLSSSLPAGPSKGL